MVHINVDIRLQHVHRCDRTVNFGSCVTSTEMKFRDAASGTTTDGSLCGSVRSAISVRPTYLERAVVDGQDGAHGIGSSSQRLIKELVT